MGWDYGCFAGSNDFLRDEFHSDDLSDTYPVAVFQKFKRKGIVFHNVPEKQIVIYLPSRSDFSYFLGGGPEVTRGEFEMDIVRYGYGRVLIVPVSQGTKISRELLLFRHRRTTFFWPSTNRQQILVFEIDLMER